MFKMFLGNDFILCVCVLSVGKTKDLQKKTINIEMYNVN